MAILRGARRFNVVSCGRRFGKSQLSLIRAIRPMLDGEPVAYFAPTYKMMTQYWREAENLYAPIITTRNKSEHRLDIVGGGSLQMWSLDSADTVRGRKYSLALIDEAAMVANLEDAWNAVIRPTLTDYAGGADFYSTPKGLNYFFQLFSRGADELQPDYASFHFPTSENPFIAPTEIDAARDELPVDVFRQEYLAEFIEGEGAVFRNITANLTAKPSNPADHEGHIIVAGVDWGQVNDFTAISLVCEKCKTEVALDRFNRIDWTFQRARLVALLDKWRVAFALIEENSIGSPNLEELRKTFNKARGFQTTAQSKPPLIQSLALAFEQEEIAWFDDSIASRELEAYAATKSETTGRISYGAPAGFHDDTVIARALAVEALEQRKLNQWSVTFRPRR